MMIIMDQLDPENQDPNFHPEFLVGAPEILDPYNDVMIPSYGITDQESASRIRSVYSLWEKDNGISGGRRTIETPGG
jgi:hypothetical protein